MKTTIKMRRYRLPDYTFRSECVVLAAGDFPRGEVACALLRGAEQVICCDSAAEEFCAWGGVPAAIVGDMDSLTNDLRVKFADRLIVRPDQNTNDLWKGITYAIDQGFRKITVLGAFGKREDHTLGNLMLLAARLREAELQMVGDRGVFNFIDEPSEFESFAGQQVSLFTLDHTAEISVRGLRYEPPQNRLVAMWQGVSNESLGEEFSVTTNSPTIVYRLF